jgi:hypothetical protein
MSFFLITNTRIILYIKRDKKKVQNINGTIETYVFMSKTGFSVLPKK